MAITKSKQVLGLSYLGAMILSIAFIFYNLKMSVASITFTFSFITISSTIAYLIESIVKEVAMDDVWI